MQTIIRTFSFVNNFHIQILIAELLFCFSLKRKINNLVFAIPGTIVYCMIPYLFPQSFFWHGFMIGKWFTLSFIMLFVLSLFLIWLYFDIPSLKELVFYGAAACILQHLVHNIYRVLDLIFSLDNPMLREMVQIIVTAVIYSIFYLIFIKRLTRGDVTGVKNVFLIIFTVFSMFLIYFLSLWTTLEEVETIGSNLFDSFCCVLLLLLQFGMFEWSKLQKQNEIMQQFLHIEEEKHAISMENIELINMKCHDLKYQIAALRHIDNRSEQEKSIKAIERAIMIYDMSASTGNEALDLVLAEKSLIFQKYGISFSCIADGIKLNFISPTDIYSLFGNALDNAIESVCRIENQEKRIISLNISCRGNCLVVHMNNYNEQPLVFEEGLPVTTKSEKDYHGYGMRSMRYLTEKYGGTMSILSDNNIFALNLLFPLKA